MRPWQCWYGPQQSRHTEPALFFLFVCPAWLVTWRCESSGELVVAIQANRKASRVTDTLKEAGSESVG